MTPASAPTASVTATPSLASTEAEAPSYRSRQDPIEVKTRVELVHMAYRELAGGTLASTAVALAFAGVVAWENPSFAIAWWVALMLVLSGVRFWLAWAFPRKARAADECPRWSLACIGVTGLSGLGWGFTTWIFPTLSGGGRLAALHVLVLAGLTAGSARLLLPMRKGSVLYLFAIMLPLAAHYFSEADLIGAVAGTCVLCFIAYMLTASLRNHQTLSDALVMRFEREALAAQLTEENARRETREAELREAREKAEQASRAKGEFLATISHEIRTPMNGVLGMLRVVRDTPLSIEQRGYLKTASDSAESLLLLLNDVLDFSKIEAGRLELESATFPLASVVRGVGDLMHTRARDKGLQFELHFAEEVPHTIVGDATRVRQVLVNLLGNAIKFTERGHVKLHVSCAERTEQRAVLHFAVVDTGIGISSAAQQKLFKPFTQADTSMSRRYGGSGLGLAISMRLAQAMGGSIQLQSALNQGSTFRLVLPCRVPEQTAPSRAEKAARFVTPSLAGRVLVVEDDAVNVQVVDLFLRKLGVTPVFAADGEIGIATAAAEPFDLVLMDCQLPGIDGLETTRRIRAKLAGRPLPIIALTANVSLQVREACLAAGMDDFLSKPVRFELLASVLQRYLTAAAA